MSENGGAAGDVPVLTKTTAQELNDCANRMRITSIEITNAAKSGHPTSACSAAEIMAVLFFNEMKYNVKTPRDAHSDRFVMSKGHACPVLYAAWQETGHLSKADIMQLRRIDSDIEGHPTPRLDFIDVATGSLGQGLSCAAGMAWVGKYVDKASYRVYCLIGDGESAEGSIWEAAAFASNKKLDNLVAIFDVNRLGQSQATALGHDIKTYQQRLQAFGFHTLVVDGHSVEELSSALAAARTIKDQPVAIVAKTFKGRGITGCEDLDNWHGKPVGDHGLKDIAGRISNTGAIKLCVTPPTLDAPKVDLNLGHIKLTPAPDYKIGDKVATRMAYGTALAKLGAVCPRVVAFDGDTKNSTFTDRFMKLFPDRFGECFIAEQNMVGVAVGAGCRHRTIPFCSTFAAFFTRAADQLRMAGVSMANIKCVGSHVGVSIGEDGPSQMGLEDLALFRSLQGSTVFYPSDAVSCERAVELAANIDGICFIRTGRPADAVIYANDEPMRVGQAKVVRQSSADKVLLIGAGVTLHECLKTADSLATQGVACCVIDPFTIKPLDGVTIREHAKRVGGRVVTVEDHYPEGGIGEAVSAVLSGETGVRVHHIAVTELPRSGPPMELMDKYGITARHIELAVKKLFA